MLKKMLLTLLLALGLSTPCFAAQWYWMGAGEDGSQWYIDNLLVEKNELYAWVRLRTDLPTGGQVFTEVQLDQRHNTMSPLFTMSYDAQGKVLVPDTDQNPESDNPAWVPVPKGSIYQRSFQYIWPTHFTAYDYRHTTC